MGDTDGVVSLVPSHCEGLPDVREVVVRPDCLEVNSEGNRITFPFSKIGRRQESALRSFIKRLVGRRPFALLVGERDWCRPPSERYFVWYTTPPVKTYMPDDEGTSYSESYFPRIHEVMAGGLYGTFDLA